ncbi:MAG: hypothetical protein QNJ91_15600 [Gammaproteobacteria bacterium]|nr:hypothetical protein [Gammaproteobacteria bacterium]
MRSALTTITLLGLPALAAAHVADAPLLQHALDHAWLALLLGPLVLWLLPIGRERR